MNARQKLKWELIGDISRRILLDGKTYLCEGQGFERHDCLGGAEMHEVFVTRETIKKMPGRKRLYFWHRVNCSLLCSWFHQKRATSKSFQRWWRVRVEGLYGPLAVQRWFDEAPLKVHYEG